MFFTKPVLLKPKRCTNALLSFTTSVFHGWTEVLASNDVLFAAGRRACQNDVVVFSADGRLSVGQVMFTIAVDGDCWTCVKSWTGLGNNRFSVVPHQPVLIPSSGIKETCTYCLAGDNALVIPP